MPFSSLGLSDPILRTIREKGYITPTPIQVKAIPAVLSGKDVMATAQTGTGKTASFVLPMLQRLTGGSRVKSNHIRALVLTPTRELAIQVAENIYNYGKHLSLKSGVVYGGVKINPQMMQLRTGVDVLVATPGRLLDLFNQNAVKFAQLETLVLDEADRMLDMGFIGEIREILALLPKRRQNLLFSATSSTEIDKLTNGLLNNPVQIEISPRNSAAENVKQWIYEVDKSRKSALLSHLIRNNGWEQLLVFTRTRDGADLLVQKLNRDGISATAIHGNKSQGERSRALDALKTNSIRVLVATDVAARGIDIRELPRVINFDLPKVPEDYVHRIGRTGRAGSPGKGISLVSADEVKLLAAIEALIRQTLIREVETGFIPTHNVPLTRQMRLRSKKPKKLKKLQDQTTRESRTTGGDPKRGGNQSRSGRRQQDEDKQKETAEATAGQKRRRGNAYRKKR